MTNSSSKKGVIGILTGGGDVPGLNPAIRAVTIRAMGEGYEVIGLRRGWASLVDLVRDKDYDNSDNFQSLSEELVNRTGRSGGTFLHTSRTNPSRIRRPNVPLHLQDTYNAEKNDLTPEVLKNLEWLGIKYLIPIGGDDTLSYAVRMSQEGVKVFGRYAGFTAILPTMAGAAHRCVIPEYRFNIELLTELLMLDRRRNPSRYAVVLISEGAMFEGGEMVFEDAAADAYGHRKLGGIGDLVSHKLKELSAKYNHGKTVDVMNQKLGYLVRCGDPDAIDSIVPMAFGNLALDLLLNGMHGRLVVLKDGRYDNVPIEAVIASKKVVNVKEHYNTERLRPLYKSFQMKPLFIMASMG